MEIKIEKSLLKALAVIVIAVTVWGVWVKRTSAPTARVASPAPAVGQPAVPPPAPISSGLTREDTGGEVTVSVTPVASGDAELGFDVAINTHSVDMSAFDPKKQIVLVGADGKDVLSSKVATEGSGHHQQLQVTFSKVAKPWKLMVRNVGGIPAREFSW